MHFSAMFPEDPDAFKNFADYIAKLGITLCFEVVVRDILGPHGAKPNYPYIALIAITSPGPSLTRKIWDIQQILEFASIYYFIIPGGAIYTDIQKIEVFDTQKFHLQSKGIEDILHMDSSISWACNSAFPATHTNVQGDIAEGLVITKLVGDETVLSEIRNSAEKYNAAMIGKTEEINHLLQLSKCIYDRNIYELHASLSDGGNKLTKIEYEGKRAVIEALSRKSGMFKHLFDHYGEQCKLNFYRGNSALYAHLHIFNDDIFASIKFCYHDELYRGLVFSISTDLDTAEISPSSAPYIFGEQISEIMARSNGLRIVEIVKVKCLAYIIRTFGVRNNLKHLSGPFDSTKLIKNFMKNWSIPERYRSAVSKYLQGIYEMIAKTKMPDNFNYLDILEIYHATNVLAKEFRALLGIEETEEFLHICANNLFVLDFKGCRLEDFIRGYGIEPKKLGGKSDIGKMVKFINGNSLVVIIYDETDESMKKMVEGVKKKISSHLLENPSSGEILEYMANHDIPLHEESAMVSVDAKSQLVAVLFIGWPIASGKTSIVKHLNVLIDGSIHLSYEGKKAQFEKALLGLSGRSTNILLIDKNHPDFNGVESTIKMLQKITNRFDIRLLLVVPNHIEPKAVYEGRIGGRTEGCSNGSTFIPGMPGLEDGKWQKIFESTFYLPCVGLNDRAKQLRGALVIDPTVSPGDNARLIADAIGSGNLGVSINDVTEDISNKEIVQTKSGNFYIAIVFNDGTHHVTLLFDLTMVPIEMVTWINGLIGTQVVVEWDLVIKAVSENTGKSVSFLVVSKITNDLGEELFGEYEKYKHLHITLNGSTRGRFGLEPKDALAAMKQLRMDDPIEGSDTFRLEITPITEIRSAIGVISKVYK